MGHRAFGATVNEEKLAFGRVESPSARRFLPCLKACPSVMVEFVVVECVVG